MVDRVTIAVTEESEHNVSHEIEVLSSSGGGNDEKPISGDSTIILLDADWVDSIHRKHEVEPTKLKATSSHISCSIHKVPHSIRQHEYNAYMPQVVSIGPYHRGKKGLQFMEEHKWRYVHELVTRNGKRCLEQLLIAVKVLEKRARESYSEEIKLDSDSFVEMMVLDSVFVIELLRRSFSDEEYSNDPIMSFPWLRSDLWDDLLKLENQIPFFILQYLFDLMNIENSSLMFLSLRFIRLYSPERNEANLSKISNTEVHHLLHLLHMSIIPSLNNEKLQESRARMIPSVFELQKAGIKFQKRSADSFLDIKFRNGVIKIPALLVDDKTKFLFHNLVAFEQCYCHIKQYFTPYLTLMDCLIDSAEDVGILCDNGIIDNWLSSNKEVANMFNKILKDVILEDDHYLVNVFTDINKYYQGHWHRWRATLMRNHCDNPWTITSLVAASILLVLTFLQTFNSF